MDEVVGRRGPVVGKKRRDFQQTLILILKGELGWVKVLYRPCNGREAPTEHEGGGAGELIKTNHGTRGQI